MRLPYCASLVSFVLLLGSGVARADTIFLANLTNGQENPPVVPSTSTGAPRPVSFGTAFFLLNDAMTSLSMVATIRNIDFTGSQTIDPFDNLVGGHIHASATVTPTTNAGIVWGFFGAPFNDNNPNDQVVLPFTSGVGGVILGKWDAPEGNGTTLAAQLNNILNGRSYINLHTMQFPGGEIRGALQPVGDVDPIPEPSSMLLVGLPAVALLRRRWQQRHDRG
ncbi:MAG: CHRD domain-containing protein [Acidobacteria bacterium]|nr:CHRD domain-containing protein [Acidobacteriota bacterium]